MVEDFVVDAVTHSNHCTLCFDGWTDNTGNSVWSWTANLPDARCFMLKVVNGSLDSHTATWIAGMHLMPADS